MKLTKSITKSVDHFWDSEKGVSPVISAILLVFIVFVICGGLFLYAGDWMDSHDLSNPKPVKIELDAAFCGDHANDSVRFQDNYLILKNAGGNSIPLDWTSLKITGNGNSYHGIPGQEGKMADGGIEIIYVHLNTTDKNSNYQKMNAQTIKDGKWSPGEKLILTGNDSKNSTVSSVLVGVGGDFNTSNNYGLTAGKNIEIVVIQADSKNKKNPKIIFRNNFTILKK
ncbi:type IV pilin [Methanolapillus ohkumae]